jgi:Zn-dependent protease/CBS domain-containing protein
MMNANIKLGRIWGIPIGLSNSWFLIFGLVTISLATSYFPQEYPLLSATVYVILGLLTSLLFFGSVLAHELGHSFLALRNKIPVRSITLFIFGGVAQIEKEPSSPGVELRVAIAGPLVSIGLAGLFGGLWLVAKSFSFPYVAAPAGYLMRINFMLALFNLIPGFPLDGGRVFRALVWKVTNNYFRATQVAGASGQIFAVGFIGMGLWQMFNAQFINGLWWIFIGWFLMNAASSIVSQNRVTRVLQGVKVSQAMEPNCQEIPPLMPLSTVIDQRVLTSGQHCFYISDGQNILGMLSLRDITAIPKPKWGFTTAYQAMTPINRLLHIDSEMDLLAALQEMEKANVSQVPVMEQGRLVGTLTRDRVANYLRTRSQLGV